MSDTAEIAREPAEKAAITDFDAATITTIHGFATQVLGSLGATSGVDADSTLVDDSAELAAA